MGPFSFERYRLLEWAAFAPTVGERNEAASVPGRCGDLVIDASTDVVTLGLRWNHAMGKPARHDKLNAITLSPGQTARLIINGRSTSHSGQIYTEATYNVAFGESLEPDVFVAARAPATLDMRADLF